MVVFRAGSLPSLAVALVLLLAACPPREEPPDPRSAPTGRTETLVPGEEGKEKDPSPGIDARERQDERDSMVQVQLAGRDIEDKRVLEAMGKVLRHRLVPESSRSYAYLDTAMPIGHGQTISQPYMVALMTEKLAADGEAKILEIGTGSGYQAAVLAEICKEIYTMEIVEPLSRRAAEALRALGYGNIHTKVGDGYYGWKEHAPYDGIIVTAAASHIPPALLEQLKEGGRLVIPLGNPLFYQTLTVIEKKGDSFLTTRSTACTFVPMTGAVQEK